LGELRVIFDTSATSGGKMAVIRRSVFIVLRATLLIGALIAPLVILTAHLSKTTAAPEKNVCVTATWKGNSNIVSLYGACPELVSSKPISSTSATPTPSATTTAEASSTPAPTASTTDEPISGAPATGDAEPTDSPAVTPTSDPTPDPSPSESASPNPTPTPTPTTTVVPSPSPVPSQTPSPDTTVSPTPVASSPVVPPEPDPIPIPPENTDPKTKSFMFCHNGGMLSNSYTGMMSGHHGNHPEDIIPPIPFKFYGGWNWNATNAKTFYNNCIPVK
jgi:hypothetical protein